MRLHHYIDLNSFFKKTMHYEDITDLFKHENMLSLNKLIKKIAPQMSESDFYFLSVIPKKLLDFEFIDYEETPLGNLKFFEALNNEGFILNEQDITNWKEYIESYDLDSFLTDEDYSDEGSNDDDLDESILMERKTQILAQFDKLTKSTNRNKL